MKDVVLKMDAELSGFFCWEMDRDMVKTRECMQLYDGRGESIELQHIHFSSKSFETIDKENRSMVLVHSKTANLVCTLHIFQRSTDLFIVVVVFYIEAFVSISYEKSKEKEIY